MKKSSLIALIGVCLFLLNHIYYTIANACEAWQHEWYQTLSYAWSIVVIIAWILIGQFFLTLYKKSK